MSDHLLGTRHLVIPDTQIKPGVPTDHLVWAARYAADKKLDTIVILGDWFDFPSLSSYDKGKLASHGRAVAKDIKAGNDALALFDATLKKHSKRGYNPRKVVTLGNHEERMFRHVQANPELDGFLTEDLMHFSRYGWKVSPFLKPVVVDGVTYMHFCPLNAQGRVSASKYGAPSALAQARRMMTSTVCGHRQGLDTAIVHTPSRTIRGIIAGSFYQHQEDYLTACGDNYWRGCLVLNDVRTKTGEFDIMELSLDYLRRKYA